MGSIGTSRIIHTRSKFFDEAVFNRLPKKLKTDNIIDIGKYKDADGTRYNAVVEFNDGFQRSISEYGWADFKDYLEEVLLVNRKAER